ncbi:MAG: FAD-dependent oxidoreductase, partial [Gemmatimonadetes bacterium]|nr:FAD-dependent oxidoreductase [Gemmatimonadota bacterium]
DVIVIGGGITGAMAAWDAAQRGLRVALLERDDFGGATSSHSLKFAHGGIRYLQHLDVRRLRDSRSERTALLRIAPHCVSLIPVAVPCHGFGLASTGAFRAALGAVRLLTAGVNVDKTIPSRGEVRSRILSKREFRSTFEAFADEHHSGAAVFCDGHIYNPPRLVYSIVESARRLGAQTLNYCEVTGLRTTGDRVVGVDARDRVTGAELEIDARVVLNCAGPFAEQWLVDSGVTRERRVPLSRDLAVVVRRSLTDGETAFALQTKYADPDAVLSRGNRHLFLVPWRGHTLIGVDSRVYGGDPYALGVTDEEVRGFLAEINEAAPALDLSLDDVTRVHYGLLPFGENDANATDLSFGKRSPIFDHADHGGPDGLVTAMSVRLTMGRAVAESAVDLALRKLHRQHTPSATARTPLIGGEFESFDQLLADAWAMLPQSTDPDAVDALARNRGRDIANIREAIVENASSGRALDRSSVLEAEIIAAARHEQVVHLDDVVLRRTELGTAGRPTDAALRRCAELVGAELGWDARRRERELERVEREYPDWIHTGRVRARIELDAVAIP